MTTEEQFFIGIDGGGTGCRARIRGADGNILAEANGGPANLYQDFAAGLANIRMLINEAARIAEVSKSSLHAGLGLAGLVTSVDPAAVAATDFGLASVVADVDAHIACLGAFGGGEGGIIIAGTGSIAYGLGNGTRHMIGGWGIPLGDRGSGAWLGLEAMKLAVEAHDGFRPASAITRYINNAIGTSMFEMSTWSERAKSGDYAAFAPQLFKLAEAGEADCVELVRQGAAAIAQLAEALVRRGIHRICLLGGLSAAYGPYLPAAISSRLAPPQADALDGAILMARQRLLNQQAP